MSHRFYDLWLNILMTLAPETQLGRYEIRSLLGAGGMGEVYLAQDMSLNRKVALKVLPADVASNQDRMRRFKQKTELLFADLQEFACSSRNVPSDKADRLRH